MYLFSHFLQEEEIKAKSCHTVNALGKYLPYLEAFAVIEAS